MKLKVGVGIHNRFDIEVRDAITGELKQTARAFNIVLDQMYTRLCAGNSYFVNIHFGTGTGTLAASRTTLFTWLGTKTAETVETIKAFPTSSWQRKIVLNPEEYVGSTITEVGIGYSSSASSLVTHAMLKDSEGNPISILKTEFDVVVIYSTVFVSFPDKEGVRLISMPNNNQLVNYLVGGGSFPSGAFNVGRSAIPIEYYPSGSVAESIGSTGTVSWVADVANKKRLTNAVRLGISSGNGHIKELGFPSLFRSVLPAEGIYEGKGYTGVVIGEGDGNSTHYLLPSLNVRQGSVAIKVNGAQASFNSELVSLSVPRAVRLDNPSSLPGEPGRGVALSADGAIMAVAHYGSPYITTYDWVEGAWVKRDDPSSLPTGTGRGVALSADGAIMAVAHYGSPYITTYDWVEGAWVKRDDPSSLPGDSGYGVALSADGAIMAVAHAGSPYITTYDWVGSAWVKRDNPSSLPTGIGNGVALSADGTIMAVAHDSSPFVTTYDWVEGAWVKRDDPSSLPGDSGYGVALSADGAIMAVAHTGSLYITTYDWVEGAWVKRDNPSSLPTGTGRGVALSADGTIMAVAHAGSLYITTYDWVEGAWVKRDNPSSLPTGIGRGVALSADGTIMAVAHDSSPFITTYWADIAPPTTQITLDTAPPAGAVITADYTVDGIHKTDQYVIDLSMAIQFGEVQQP